MPTSSVLRACMRTSRSLRCQTSAPSSTSRCIATPICSWRRSLTSASSSTSPLYSSSPEPRAPTTPSRKAQLAKGSWNSVQDKGAVSRAYSTKEGTIGSGEEGVGGQAVAEAPEHLNPKEKEIWGLLMKELECSALDVADVSGGCGSMYAIDIVSEKFRGLSILKQQRLVNKVLGEEIKGWHGVQLKTRAP